jgi:uncharacterized protein YjdB
MRILSTIALAVVVACDHAPTAAKTDTTTPVDCTLQGLTVSPASAAVFVGDTIRLTAHEPTCSGSTLPTTVGWRSSDSTFAAVDSLSGLVHARAAGNVTILAFQISDSSVKGAMALVVKAR